MRSAAGPRWATRPAPRTFRCGWRPWTACASRGCGSSFRSRRGHRLDVDVGQRVRLVALAQAAGAVAGQDPPAADERDVLAQLLGLLEVVRGEQDRRALGV